MVKVIKMNSRDRALFADATAWLADVDTAADDDQTLAHTQTHTPNPTPTTPSAPTPPAAAAATDEELVTPARTMRAPTTSTAIASTATSVEVSSRSTRTAVRRAVVVDETTTPMPPTLPADHEARQLAKALAAEKSRADRLERVLRKTTAKLADADLVRARLAVVEDTLADGLAEAEVALRCADDRIGAELSAATKRLNAHLADAVRSKVAHHLATLGQGCHTAPTPVTPAEAERDSAAAAAVGNLSAGGQRSEPTASASPEASITSSITPHELEEQVQALHEQLARESHAAAESEKLSRKLVGELKRMIIDEHLARPLPVAWLHNTQARLEATLRECSRNLVSVRTEPVGGRAAFASGDAKGKLDADGKADASSPAA